MTGSLAKYLKRKKLAQ